MKTLHHLTLAAVIAASVGFLSNPAPAQQAASRWRPSLESVIVSAKPNKNYRLVLSSSHLGEAFIVSASMEVPYNDLNLANDPDDAELGRRIHVAAHLICQEMDLKYP